ncbi:MAG: hypothetical protein GX096_02045 [Clostridiales bacterium]|nr:hypothetical protein [Clostridiales bacterium]
MSKKMIRKIAPWMIGVLITTLLFAALKSISYFRFENSDDILFVKGFMGFEGGKPMKFNLYTNVVLVKLLGVLSAVMPAVAWFSVYQLGLLWISGVVIVKSFVQISANNQRSYLMGALAGAVFLGVLATFAFCRITYTSTVAWACAAAVAQILSIDRNSTDSQYISKIILSVVLLSCGYLLRAEAVLPAVPFIGLALLYRFIKFDETNQKYMVVTKQLVTSILLFIAVFALLFAMRALEISLSDQSSYVKWSQARIDLFDYTGFESDIEPALNAQTDLSEAEITLLQDWYFMDERITIDRLLAMSQAYEGHTTNDVFSNISSFFSSNKRYITSIWLVICAAAFCLLRRRRNTSLLFVIAAAVAAALTMLLYLSVKGRIIFRAVDCIWLPMASLIGCLFIENADLLGKHAKTQKIIAVALSIMMVFSIGLTGSQLWQTVRSKPDEISLQRESEIEAFALENPDKLVLRKPSLLRDTRLFPDVSEGMPTNIMIWGDWYARTPSWYSQLESFGIDGETFNAQDWLNPAILFASQDDLPPQALINYISEYVGHPITAQVYGEYGSLKFFSFQ